jgi:hypothetical protein
MFLRRRQLAIPSHQDDGKLQFARFEIVLAGKIRLQINQRTGSGALL